jgi:glucosamine-6-phosphate isomerase
MYKSCFNVAVNKRYLSNTGTIVYLINLKIMIARFTDYQELSACAADKIVKLVQQKPTAVLCLAGGDTPALTYDLIAEKVQKESVDFSGVTFIGLDEWVGIEKGMPGSCYNFLQQKVFGPLSIQEENIYFFDAMSNNLEDECNRINLAIHNKGGIDLALVGIGMNGHIGFNEPGINTVLNAHVVELDEVTTTVGQKYFTSSTALAKGITLGMAQIMAARELLLIASGEKKAAIIRKTIKEGISTAVPASLITAHPNGLILLDAAAAAGLD